MRNRKWSDIYLCLAPPRIISSRILIHLVLPHKLSPKYCRRNKSLLLVLPPPEWYILNSREGCLPLTLLFRHIVSSIFIDYLDYHRLSVSSSAAVDGRGDAIRIIYPSCCPVLEVRQVGKQVAYLNYSHKRFPLSLVLYPPLHGH